MTQDNIIPKSAKPADGVSVNEFDSQNCYDPDLMLEQVLADLSLTQFWQRHEIDGQDSISAFYRCSFSAGQQRYILHVPFHPPFRNVPNVSVTFADDTSGRIRVTNQQKFGARVEIVLGETLETTHSCVVEFTAESH